MKLHEAIKKLIDIKGPFIIFEEKFIQNLVWYGAFEYAPYLQFDLENLIRRGELRVFKDKEDWILFQVNHKTNLARKYPFMQNRISYIMDAIAFGLKYINKCPNFKFQCSNTPPINIKVNSKDVGFYECRCIPNCKYRALKQKNLLGML